MNVYRYLEQYEEAERKVAKLRKEYDEEVQRIDSLRSPLGDDGSPKSGKISRTVERRAVKLADRALVLKDAEADALWIRQEVYDTVNKVTGPEGSVLFERYINLKKWRQVAHDLGYTERQCFNLRDKGIRKVDELLSDKCDSSI